MVKIEIYALCIGPGRIGHSAGIDWSYQIDIGCIGRVIDSDKWQFFHHS